MLVKEAHGRSMEDYYIEKLLQIRNIPDELANVKIVGDQRSVDCDIYNSLFLTHNTGFCYFSISNKIAKSRWFMINGLYIRQRNYVWLENAQSKIYAVLFKSVSTTVYDFLDIKDKYRNTFILIPFTYNLKPAKHYLEFVSGKSHTVMPFHSALSELRYYRGWVEVCSFLLIVILSWRCWTPYQYKDRLSSCGDFHYKDLLWEFLYW